jgi:glycosyltransferase involved in cell wall biosynthesis
MPHGMLDPYFQRLDVRPIKAIRNWLFWKLVEGRVVNDAAGLLFTCEEERRLARRPFRPYRPQREDIVGLGVQAPPPFDDRMTGAFQKEGGVGGEPYLLFLGRIHPKKGVDLLVRGYAAVARKHSGRAFPRLVIAGPASDPMYLAELKALSVEICAAHALPPVIFVEMLSGDAKWGALHGCEAFVLPSHQENFGIAVIEALACGRPVLISDKVNIWREIEADGAGLVGSDSEEGVVRMLEVWLSQDSLSRQKMELQAAECFIRRFDSPRMGEAFENACHISFHHSLEQCKQASR